MRACALSGSPGSRPSLQRDDAERSTFCHAIAPGISNRSPIAASIRGVLRLSTRTAGSHRLRTTRTEAHAERAKRRTVRRFRLRADRGRNGQPLRRWARSVGQSIIRPHILHYECTPRRRPRRARAQAAGGVPDLRSGPGRGPRGGRRPGRRHRARLAWPGAVFATGVLARPGRLFSRCRPGGPRQRAVRRVRLHSRSARVPAVGSCRRPVTGVRYVNFARAAEQYHREIGAALARVVDSGVYVGGPEVEEFERAFAGYCGTTYAVGVANGTEALELTLRAWGVGAGDEVIVPANTAMPTALAVTHTGARVVPVDVENDTGLIDPAAVEAALTPATRVIVPVHLYGHPADADRLARCARHAGVRVLEDAAHAHGAAYRGRRCGGLADAAAFSFYPTKNLGAFGDAGCITTNDAQLATAVRRLRNLGATSGYDHAVPGYNSRLDPLQAAVLRWKLTQLDAWNARRRELAALYSAELGTLDALTLPAVRAWATPVWHAFAVRVRGGLRDALQHALAADGIETNVHYRTPIHLQSCYADQGWRRGDRPVSEARADELLSLPLDPFHSPEEIARVASSVRMALARLDTANAGAV